MVVDKELAGVAGASGPSSSRLTPSRRVRFLVRDITRDISSGEEPDLQFLGGPFHYKTRSISRRRASVVGHTSIDTSASLVERSTEGPSGV